MGSFTVPIQLGDLAGQRFIDLEALVDTGATYTSIPETTLAQLGIEIRESCSFDIRRFRGQGRILAGQPDLRSWRRKGITALGAAAGIRGPIGPGRHPFDTQAFHCL